MLILRERQSATSNFAHVLHHKIAKVLLPIIRLSIPVQYTKKEEEGWRSCAIVSGSVL